MAPADEAADEAAADSALRVARMSCTRRIAAITSGFVLVRIVEMSPTLIPPAARQQDRKGGGSACHSKPVEGAERRDPPPKKKQNHLHGYLLKPCPRTLVNGSNESVGVVKLRRDLANPHEEPRGIGDRQQLLGVKAKDCQRKLAAELGHKQGEEKEEGEPMKTSAANQTTHYFQIKQATFSRSRRANM